MNISARFIHRPIATTMLMAAILLLGLIGWTWLITTKALGSLGEPRDVVE